LKLISEQETALAIKAASLAKNSAEFLILRAQDFRVIRSRLGMGEKVVHLVGRNVG
jgi:hypothetical protein